MIDDNISLEDYHKLPAKSAHFLMDDPETAEYDQKHPEKPSTTVQKRLDLGSNIHTAVETKDMDSHFIRIPEDLWEKRLTKAGKRELIDFRNLYAADNLTAVSEDEWKIIWGCMDAAWSNIYAKPYLEAAKFERSGFTNINGVEVKARPDLDCYEHQRTLVDIKTRQKGAAALVKWDKDFWNYRTYVQAGLQLLVWEKLNMPCQHYYYLLVEIKQPHRVNLVYLDEELMEISKDRTIEALEKWKSWIGAGSPKGYGQPQKMHTKPWYRNYELTL